MEKGYSHIEAQKCIDKYLNMLDGNRGIFCEAPEDNTFHATLDQDENGDYYLMIRGTDPFNLKDLIIDVEVFTTKPFPFDVNTSLKPHISRGLIVTFNGLKEKLEPVLRDLPNRSNLFITGHSEGAAAASVFALWIQTTFQEKFLIKTYAFAPPSITNTDFNTLACKYNPLGIYRIVNPNDIIPYFYTDIPKAIKNHIPTKIPLLLKLVFYTTHLLIKCKRIKYAHVGETIVLKKKDIKTCTFSFFNPFKLFSCLALSQHDSSRYKDLLDR